MKIRIRRTMERPAMTDTLDVDGWATTECNMLYWREFDDGIVAGVVPMMFGWRLVSGPAFGFGYDRGFCYHHLDRAIQAIIEMESSSDEPDGWHKEVPAAVAPTGTRPSNMSLPDVAVLPRIMAPWQMAAALTLPIVVAVVAGVDAVGFTVGWLLGWAVFAAVAVRAHRRRRLRELGGPTGVKVWMLDGRIVDVDVTYCGIRDGVRTWATSPVDGPVRSVKVAWMPPRSAIRVTVREADA